MNDTTPDIPPFLRARAVGVTFAGGVEALRGVDLDLPAGEFAAIVGPSGCGKSTFLRVVAGLVPCSGGSVEIEGRGSTSARREGGDIAFVFQAPTLLPWRTVEKNVQLPLELNGTLDAAARGRIDETLELVGLSDFRKSHPHQLSGGMQMRVSLARALVTRPRLLLLDEPFGALDDITRQRLNEELIALWERDRFTALFVTHNVSEAVFLAHRVIVMSARPGHILADHEIPMLHPRTPELRASAEFAHQCGIIGESLRAGFAAAK